MASILSLDLGEKRVGVAVSDETQTIASPLMTLTFKGRQKLLNDLKPILDRYHANTIIVGLPLGEDGEINTASKNIMAHVQWFQSQSPWQWELFDERYTTKESESILLEVNLSRKRRKNIIDRVAAQKILQAYLDARRNQNPQDRSCD